MTKRFTYRDNATGAYKGAEWVGKVVFECIASGILEADKLFEEADIKFEVKRKDKNVTLSSKSGTSTLPFIGCSSSPVTFRELQDLEKAKRLKALDETMARVQREADTYPRPWDLPKKEARTADSTITWAIIGLHAAYEKDAQNLKQYPDQVTLGHAKTARDRADALKELMKIIIKGE